MHDTDESPLIQDASTWPVAFDLPSISLLRVLHYTTQTEVNEGGFLIAINGEPLPIVFVGLEPEIAQPTNDSSLWLLELVTALGRELAPTEVPRLEYATIKDMILDGWRPAERGDEKY